jgi:thioredoxin
MRLIDKTDADFDDYVVQSGRPALVVFWAPWSAPDRMMMPVIEEFADHFDTTLAVIRVNVDDCPRTAKQYQVRVVPTMLIFDDGEPRDRLVGVQPLQQLIEMARPYARPVGEPTSDTEILGIASVEGRLRVVALLQDGSYRFVDQTSKLHGLLYHISADDIALRNAVEEFERMINDPELKEKDFQDFFETYPEFILNEDYKEAHPHVVLHRDEGDLIPDFFLEPINTDHLCDILDIKTPAARVFTIKKNRPRFSAAVLDGIAQLREYQGYFDDLEARRRVESEYGLVAYKPRLFLIIGKRGSVDPFAVKRMEQGFSDVSVRTYDDILKRMEAKLLRYRRDN